MKISKTLLGGIALLGMTGLASAQTKIYITGSTAFRASANYVIDNLLNGSGGYTKASDNAIFASANAITWTGGKIDNMPVTIKVSFSDSYAGIQTVASKRLKVGFLPDGAAGTDNPDPRPYNSGVPQELAVPDIALSDLFQGTTPFNGTFNGYSYGELTDYVVGVVAFTFAGSKNFPAGQSMTPQIAQILFAGGLVPLSEFTGSANDDNTGVIATGRDAAASTRLTAVAETNVGTGAALRQYKPTVSSGTVTSLALYPAQSINGVPHRAGDGGESVDGTLREYLTDVVSASAAQQVDNTLSGGYLATYLSVSDFNAVSGRGAVALAYNGVPESQNNIIEGAYTFWSYEHVLYFDDSYSNPHDVKVTFATSLARQISYLRSTTLNPNVGLYDLKVQRFNDGGVVSSLLH